MSKHTDKQNTTTKGSNDGIVIERVKMVDKAILERRLLSFFIDSVLIALIVILYHILIRYLIRINVISIGHEGVGLIIHGLYLMATGITKIISTLLMPLFFIDMLLKMIYGGFDVIVSWQYFAFYLFFESVFSTTPGKYITGTTIIRNNGSKPRFIHIVIRTLARLLPFEVFSFLPSKTDFWHDRLSGTKVIYRRKY